ncbi:MAG: radical SAM protein [Clostridia bacterium]|nr:radical SAM protein [Clostridia bacterium]
MFKKIYLEITNVCNLNCSFCHKTSRKKKFLSEEEFSLLIKKIRPYTEYLYLHLMGEPLLHPKIGAFLEAATELSFKVTVATNGFLIKEKENELLNCPPYKVTISLHSYEANETDVSLDEYLDNIINFCKKAEKKGTICVLRLWNENGENKLNGAITEKLKSEFLFRENRKGYTLSEKIFLEEAEKFIWPDKAAPIQPVRFCMGLRDHIGVLSDGSVVPCCLDADGEMTLGDLFTEDIKDIINKPRAKAIYDGFSQADPPEEMCRRCQYASRWTAK